MNGFQANPEGLMEKGSKVTTIYNEYMVEKGIVDKTTDKIATAWQGADSAGYVSQIHSYDGDFKKLGEVIAKKALDKGIKTVVFDRGGFVYQGKIKALAEAAREAGLDF